MSKRPSSYLSSKLEGRPKANGSGNGVFALQALSKGELIAVFGGVVYEWDTFIHFPERERSLSIQFEDDLFLVPNPIGEGDYFNHSCNPNAGFSGQIGLVAMRDIQPGEEVCFDYAMSDSVPYDEFDCRCGQPNCRRQISGNDWKQAELQKRYAGFFAPHIQRKIEGGSSTKHVLDRTKRAPSVRAYGSTRTTPVYE
jgi:hypothetical protein